MDYMESIFTIETNDAPILLYIATDFTDFHRCFDLHRVIKPNTS